MRKLSVFLTRMCQRGGCLAGAGSCAVIHSLFYPWPMLGVGVVAFLYLRRSRSSSYGSARWGTANDALAANLIGGPTGLPLGYLVGAERPSLLRAARRLFTSRSKDAEGAVRHFDCALGGSKRVAREPVRLPDGVHSVVFSPPGGGKTTGFIIPALLSCSDNAVVIDLKGEIFKATAAHRARRFGSKIVALDPYGVLGPPSWTYNPLTHPDPNSDAALDEVRDLANALVFRTGRETEAHWNDSAETILTGFPAFVLAHADAQHRTLTDTQEVLADPEARAGALAAMTVSPAWGGALRRFAHQIGQFKDREANSVYSTTLRHLSFLHSPPVARFLSNGPNAFDPMSLCRDRVTVYLVLPPNHLKSQAPLLRLMVSGMFRAMFRAGTDPARRVQFFLDEAAAIGHMDSIDQAMAVGRGYGIRLNFAYQSMGQLSAAFPDGQHQTFLSCVGCQMFIGPPNDYQTAEYIQNMIGDCTIRLTNSQRNSSWSSSSSQQGHQSQWSSSSGTSTQETGRKLLQAAETFQLGPQQAIVFLPGRSRPLLTNVRRYFEDSSLTRRRWFGGRLRMLVRSVVFLAATVYLLLFLLHVREEQLRQRACPIPSPMYDPGFNPIPPGWGNPAWNPGDSVEP
ncbi:type IV secretory system conjugative DNA transfer family protein [Fimbriiglobus ruber]|uniref:Conjugal transfer coupling protein TraG n=1 Tax=Fimbriiglobus ruber TaxID=1908690 RepID=A0A225E0R8_9BACT|nr:type IV secretory system conjugative DNA transfer family protein [Fimbriiglobus ruber]OWK47320.1 Conjugal transfer coupling protein TraG [Fimbriiglobus ruber]